jgi:hypothetical protein
MQEADPTADLIPIVVTVSPQLLQGITVVKEIQINKAEQVKVRRTPLLELQAPHRRELPVFTLKSLAEGL